MCYLLANDLMAETLQCSVKLQQLLITLVRCWLLRARVSICHPAGCQNQTVRGSSSGVAQM